MKRICRKLLVVSFLPLLTLACNKAPENTPAPGPDDPVVEPELVTVTYTASDEDFPNPERGFYVASEAHSADGRGVAEVSIKSARLQGRSLFLLEFYLTDYVNSDIAPEYLETIRLRFQSLRDGGVKCILRFCYSNGFSEDDKPWDATPEQALRHLEQVKPLMQEYADVIMVVQAGFVGSWGEWYYTENYTDNESRRALVDALLSAVPENRQIELRTPAFKMTLYGQSLDDTLTRAEAHQPTDKARLGGHNDCYLSSGNDVGTFRGPNDRAYWEAESRYTIMGGESCDVTQFCHCEGKENKYRGALKDLAMSHFTYLNSGYHPNVLRRWREEGCMETIKRRLGYRYVLEKGEFTKEAKAGKPFQVKLTLHNDGFAPAQNPRDAELVLTDKSGKVLGTWTLESDPRYWMPEQVTVVDQTITLPEGISGQVTLSLNLPDPYETLHTDPRFSIRLANEGVWDENTGYNKLTDITL